MYRIFRLLMLTFHFIPGFLQNNSIRYPIAVGFGAISGALSRYYLSIWLPTFLGTSFPYSTLLVNLSGSWVMGLFVTLILNGVLLVSPELQLLISVGFLGSFTTFSSYELDVFHLAEQNGVGFAISYLMGSAIFGVVSLYLGICTAKYLALWF